ncbi:MAG: hypothetical protein WBQ69_03425 [Gallionella sp.]
MKSILFMAILGLISSVPAYAAAAGNGHAGGHGFGGGHASGHTAGYGSGGWRTTAIPTGSVANKDPTPSHGKKKGQGGGYVEDPKVTQSRIEWQRQQQAAQLRAAAGF